MGRRRRAALNDRAVSARRRSIQIPEAPSNPYKLNTAAEAPTLTVIGCEKEVNEAGNDTCAEIDHHEREPSDETLEQKADLRESRHVDQELQDAAVEEHCGDEPPPLAVRRARSEVPAPRDEALRIAERRAAGADNDEGESEDVNSQQPNRHERQRPACAERVEKRLRFLPVQVDLLLELQKEGQAPRHRRRRSSAVVKYHATPPSTSRTITSCGWQDRTQEMCPAKSTYFL